MKELLFSLGIIIIFGCILFKAILLHPNSWVVGLIACSSAIIIMYVLLRIAGIKEESDLKSHDHSNNRSQTRQTRK